MSLIPGNVIAGMVLALIIALAAWRVRALNLQGAIAAAILGTVVFGMGGLGWAILLLAFFLSSSALSRLSRKRKKSLDEKFSKGSQRDAGQVAANGGVAGLLLFIAVLFSASGVLPAGGTVWAWAGFAGALAAANADTWATELGVLSGSVPRLINSGKVVERGTSGGVTLFGSLAALTGSALIALLAVLFWQGNVLSLPAGSPTWLSAITSPPALGLSTVQKAVWFGILTLSGLAGSLLDSLLGATLQAIYYCPSCKKETERNPLHTCGARTRQIRGLTWLNNDWVNTACTLTGSLLALAFSWLYRF